MSKTYYWTLQADDSRMGLKYKNGVNHIKNKFEDKSGNNTKWMNRRNAYSYTTKENIFHCINCCKYIIEITIPENDKDVIIIKSDEYVDTYMTNKIIVGRRFRIDDCDTIKEFNLLKYTYLMIEYAASTNNIMLLYWLQSLNVSFSDIRNACDIAAEQGHIDILEWFYTHKYRVNISDYGTNWIVISGHLHVLQWMHDKQIPIHSNKTISTALKHKQTKIIEWMKENDYYNKFLLSDKISDIEEEQKKEYSVINKFLEYLHYLS